MWDHQIIMYVARIFHLGSTPTKVVRPINEFGEPVANVILSDGQRVWEQNGLQEFAVEHTYRGNTFTVNQIHPQEPITTVVINFEPVQDVVIRDRYAKFVDEAGSPMPNLDVRTALESVGHPGTNGTIKINHFYCNQFIEAYCLACNELLCRQRVSHQNGEQRILVPGGDLIFTWSDSEAGTEVRLRSPEGKTNIWPVNESRRMPHEWCGRMIELLLPGRTEPLRVVVRHNARIDVGDLIRGLNVNRL